MPNNINIMTGIICGVRTMEVDAKGNLGENNTFNDTHLNSVGSYNPAATQVTHNVFVGSAAEYARIMRNNTSLSHNSDIMDMCYFSSTLPEIPVNEITRHGDLTICEQRLENDHVLCLYGEDGIGVTTLLSQFARKYRNNCVSYFLNGLDRIRLNREVMESDIVEQLYWYAHREGMPYNNDRPLDIASVYRDVMKRLKQEKRPIFFVFDGFDSIPTENYDNVKSLLNSLIWDNARFIFSGKKDTIKRLFPDNKRWTFSENQLAKFSEAEVKEYFKVANPDLSNDDIFQLYKISQYGNAKRMALIRSNYLDRGLLSQLLESDIKGDSDLYKADYDRILNDSDDTVQDFFAFLAFTEFPLSVNLLEEALGKDASLIESIADNYENLVVKDREGTIRLRAEGFHKYLREKMSERKKAVELRLIHILESMKDNSDYCNFIPALYKSLNQTDNLIKYLTNENVQHILIKSRSQASLNEQCGFGFEACSEKPDKYLAGLFRFSLNKSASREIEKNELWDYEIEALLAVGRYAEALTLAQNVYMSEDRLKCYLLIARKRNRLSADDNSILMDGIHQLVETIDFENIPNKALELARLLLPLDYESAVAIVDRVAKAHKQGVNTDRLYTIFSLYEKIDPDAVGEHKDLSSAKIQDDDLRKFADAAKNLFDDVSVDKFLEELDKLPNNSQKLQFLQFWLPEHEDKEGIGEAVLEALRLIVADSDTEMPKAKMLGDVCKSLHKMSHAQMQKAMGYIDSLGTTIMNPTTDYVDTMITLIEETRDVMPNKSRDMLENLYIFVDDLNDEGMRLTCLSKMLGHYDNMGSEKLMQDTLGSSSDLGNDIIKGIDKLLLDTAYHIRVVEGPIKALVCNHHDMIDRLIENVNTARRRSRAYSYAASQYLIQVEDNRLDMDYFFSLLSKAGEDYDDRRKPLDILSRKLGDYDKADKESLATSIKENFNYIEDVEFTVDRCIISLRLYIWLLKNSLDEKFASRVKHLLETGWTSLDSLHDKIILGFHMAKSIAAVSREEANEIIGKCSELKKKELMTSSSCLDTFNYSLELYSQSICKLIHLGLCDKATLDAFIDETKGLMSRSQQAMFWGRIALEYYLANDVAEFNRIGDTYLPTDFSSFPMFERKWVVYRISASLFIRSQKKFFTLLDTFDKEFANECVRRVICFIITKKTDGSTPDEKQRYELTFTDCTNILTLLDYATDEELFFNVAETFAKSLKTTNRRDPLSTEQKTSVVTEAKNIFERKLPADDGIRHDGYKIACLAAMAYIERDLQSRDKSLWEDKIKSIGNKADRAFLYFFIAPYFSKRTDKEEYFLKGIAEAESVSFTCDKVGRMDMAINECIEHNLKPLIPKVAQKAFQGLATFGTWDEYKQLVDAIYQYKPELAEQFIENMDQDPARLQYKRRLQRHISSEKKLEKAGQELLSVDNLSLREQKTFFSRQYESLSDGTGQVLGVTDAFKLTVNYIYSNSLDDTMDAILYLMESISKKQEQSKNQSSLLFDMHNAIRHNLKIVLSLAAGTKDRLDRVSSMFGEKTPHSEEFVPVGSYLEAIDTLLEWYRKLSYDELTIIDPHITPTDLSVVKQLTDQNTNLQILILTFKGKYTPDDFECEWRKISKGIRTPVKMTFVGYVRKPDDGPLHDRYWICVDDEGDKREGISLDSLSGLGNKESAISPISEELALREMHSYNRYAVKKVRANKDKELEYDEIMLK